MEKAVEKKSRIPWGFFLIGCLALAFSRMAVGAEEPTTVAPRLNRDFFLHFGKDFERVVRSPASWQKRDFLKAAALSGATLFCFALDQDIRREVLEKRTPMAQEAAQFFSAFGDGAVLLGGLAVLYGVGEIGRRDHPRRIALLSLESLATTTFFIWSSKFIFGRSRPSTGESSWKFRPFSFSSSHTSFPSGHAASAFAVATAIAEETSAPVVDGLAYGLATLVAIARATQDKHWFSDGLFGSAVGYFVARKICRLNRHREGKRAQLFFQASPRQKSLTLRLSF
ncbi:MAG: phosphatase PAP2 family protein [Candidatus Aminicenantales bacterium]